MINTVIKELSDLNMFNLGKNEIITLYHLRDKKDHYDIPHDITIYQYKNACKNLKNIGCIHYAPESTSARIKDEGLGLLDDYLEQIQNDNTMIDYKELEEEKIKIILLLGDKEKYASYEAELEDEYDELFEEFELNGYVKAASTNDDEDKLTKKGKKLFDEIEKSMKELTELDYIILDYLSYKSEPVMDIHKDCDSLRVYGREEVFHANHKLKDYSYVDFLDEPNDYFNCTWLSITDDGRKVLREYYNTKHDSNEKSHKQAPPTTGMPYVKLTSKKGTKVNLIRLVWTLCQMGMFVDDNEKRVEDKTVFELLGIAFNVDLKNYSNNLSQSMKNDSNKAIEDLFDMILNKDNPEEFAQFVEEMKAKLIETFVQKTQ